MLTDEKLDEISARLEHSSQKSLRCVAQETGVALEKHQIRSLRNSNWTHLVPWYHAIMRLQRFKQLVIFCLLSWFHSPVAWQQRVVDCWGRYKTIMNCCHKGNISLKKKHFNIRSIIMSHSKQTFTGIKNRRQKRIYNNRNMNYVLNHLTVTTQFNLAQLKMLHPLRPSKN